MVSSRSNKGEGQSALPPAPSTKRMRVILPILVISLSIGLSVWILLSTDDAALAQHPHVHAGPKKLSNAEAIALLESPRMVQRRRAELEAIEAAAKPVEQPERPEGYVTYEEFWENHREHYVFGVGGLFPSVDPYDPPKLFHLETLIEFSGNYRQYAELRETYQRLESETRDSIRATLEAQGQVVRCSSPEEYAKLWEDAAANPKPGIMPSGWEDDGIGAVPPTPYKAAFYEIPLAQYPALVEVQKAIESLEPWEAELASRARALFFY